MSMSDSDAHEEMESPSVTPELESLLRVIVKEIAGIPGGLEHLEGIVTQEKQRVEEYVAKLEAAEAEGELRRGK